MTVKIKFLRCILASLELSAAIGCNKSNAVLGYHFKNYSAGLKLGVDGGIEISEIFPLL